MTRPCDRIAQPPGAGAEFAIGTYAGADGHAFPGLVTGEDVIDLRPVFGAASTTSTLLADWDACFERLTEVNADAGLNRVPLTSLRPLAPVQPPGQILCAGANYEQHTLQMTFVGLREAAGRAGGSIDEDALWAQAQTVIASQREHGRPFFFVATPGALCGAFDDIVLRGPGIQHDWELELAVVIGKRAHQIAPAEALDVVAGYTISNDISTRDVLFRPNFGLSDFMTSKNRPTFFPTGPYFVPRQFVSDYRQLRLQLWVNDQPMQDARAGEMIFDLETLISYASELVELQPGDMILTGSPAGNAAINGNRWLRPGDRVTAEIEGLGQLRNVCVEAPQSASDPILEGV